jgi:hypothetical protein
MRPCRPPQLLPYNSATHPNVAAVYTVAVPRLLSALPWVFTSPSLLLQLLPTNHLKIHVGYATPPLGLPWVLKLWTFLPNATLKWK